MAIKKAGTQTVDVPKLNVGIVRLRIIGTSPLFQNRMSHKVKGTLLAGGGKKTRAEKAAIKHNILDEFRDSAEIMDDGPTALGLRVMAIKGAMCTAALETAGVTKTSAQRLITIHGDRVPLYGTPQLRMDVVRSADMNRTPDIRTRCFIPRWGAEVDIQYIVPQLSASAVSTLLSNAGILVGVGDFRQEKGKGAFGAFRVIGDQQQDDEWDALVLNHGRDVQAAALAAPEYANTDTEELAEFYFAEVDRRAA